MTMQILFGYLKGKIEKTPEMVGCVIKRLFLMKKPFFDYIISNSIISFGTISIFDTDISYAVLVMVSSSETFF